MNRLTPATGSAEGPATRAPPCTPDASPVEAGAWPLAGLRQSFLNGSLTRLVDPDTTLRTKIVQFVDSGDFGLASAEKLGGGYERVWFREPVAVDEVVFDADVYLLRKPAAESAKAGTPPVAAKVTEPEKVKQPEDGASLVTKDEKKEGHGAAMKTVRLVGTVPPEVWNRLGTKVLPKLRSGSELKVSVDFTVAVPAERAGALVVELKQVLEELGLNQAVRVE